MQAVQRSGEEVQLSQITFQVESAEEVMVTADAIKRTMSQLHAKEDYAVVVPLELLEQASTTRLMFKMFMGLIAAVSLVVGGIGIMNIMLATVTERTREIGVRRALGARRSHIIQQFLTETIVLTATGGLLGVALGLMCGPCVQFSRFLINTLSPDMLPPIAQTLEPRVAPWSIVLALGISIGVGVLFGVYPARQAAQMDPIEALRHE